MDFKIEFYSDLNINLHTKLISVAVYDAFIRNKKDLKEFEIKCKQNLSFIKLPFEDVKFKKLDNEEIEGNISYRNGPSVKFKINKN